jgi:hypothetical protein
MSRYLCVAAALLLSAGCATGSLLSSGPPPRSPQELFNERWVGRSEDDLLVQYGKPTEVISLSTGNYVDSYHSEVAFSASSTRASYTGNFGGQRSDSQSSTVYCDRRFEVDASTHKVVRAVITGSSCDYGR